MPFLSALQKRPPSQIDAAMAAVKKELAKELAKSATSGKRVSKSRVN